GGVPRGVVIGGAAVAWGDAACSAHGLGGLRDDGSNGLDFGWRTEDGVAVEDAIGAHDGGTGSRDFGLTQEPHLPSLHRSSSCTLTNERDFPVPNWLQSGSRQQSATMGGAKSHQLVRKGKSMSILYVGIDLAKPCTIGMEACSGAHHWARLFGALRHTVRLMARKFVPP